MVVLVCSYHINFKDEDILLINSSNKNLSEISCSLCLGVKSLDLGGVGGGRGRERWGELSHSSVDRTLYIGLSIVLGLTLLVQTKWGNMCKLSQATHPFMMFVDQV